MTKDDQTEMPVSNPALPTEYLRLAEFLEAYVLHHKSKGPTKSHRLRGLRYQLNKIL
ncbi:hypothetical protein D9M71_560070 [compost metagenome]